jgi:hypothetical protein
VWGENLSTDLARSTLATTKTAQPYADLEADRLEQLLSEIEALSEEEASGELKNAAISSPK